MKKLLLFSFILCFFIQLVSAAYETIIIDFPKGEKWNVVFYKKIGAEAILQYVPEGQTYNKWKQTIIVHSYKDNNSSPAQLSNIVTAQLQVQNPTGRYKYLKYGDFDSIAVRGTADYKGIAAQGEILRTTKAAEGLMTIQYIDRDREHFKQQFNKWLKIVRDARTYNSYWRDNYVLNKEECYEL